MLMLGYPQRLASEAGSKFKIKSIKVAKHKNRGLGFYTKFKFKIQDHTRKKEGQYQYPRVVPSSATAAN
jgi:hypothetical protein